MSVMPVDVQMRADAELGAAWRRAEAALPEGWTLEIIGRHFGGGWQVEADQAEVDPFVRPDSIYAHGPTPAAALDALTEALHRQGAA